jgi:hypothetical protein
MSPKLKPPEEVLAGKDMDEQTRVAAGGSVGPSSERGIEVGGCGNDLEPELPAGEADLAAIRK